MSNSLAMSDNSVKAGAIIDHGPLKAVMNHRWCWSSKAASPAGQKTLKREHPASLQTLMCDYLIEFESIAEPEQT